MKSMSKTIFSQYLLSNIVNDKFWRPHLDILYLSTWHNNRGYHEKEIQFKQHFCYYNYAFDYKLYGFSRPELLFFLFLFFIFHFILDRACSQCAFITICCVFALCLCLLPHNANVILDSPKFWNYLNTNSKHLGWRWP